MQQDDEVRYIPTLDYSLLESDAVQNNFADEPDASKR